MNYYFKAFINNQISSLTIPSSVETDKIMSFIDMNLLKTVVFSGKTVSQITSSHRWTFKYDLGRINTYETDYPDTSAPITVICDDGQLTVDWVIECFAKGTKILMSDGTEKNIEDIDYGDSLKVWDFDSGNVSESEVCWLTNRGQRSDHYYKLTFSDGTVLKTTGANSNHKIFNVDTNRFEGVNITEIGDRIYSFGGIVTVTDKEYVKEEVEYYNLMTTRTINCFANGILASNRQSNIYPVVNMVYDKTGRTIRPYSEFEEQGIRRYWYDNIRLGESQETVSKLAEYVGKIEFQMWKPDWWE
jgi:Hom_end-associated Hint.